MESRILINYKRAAEAAFRNIQTANMFNPVQQPEIGKDGRDPLPYVTAFLRAEDDLLEHIKLEPLNESEKEFLLSFINSTKKVESTGYCQFAADEIWEGLQEMKQRLTGEKPSYKGYVLLHNYWSKYDKTKKITNTNAKKFLSHYNLKSINEMQKAVNFSIDEFLLFYDSDNKTIHHNKVDEAIKQLNIIIPILEAQCPQAAEDARKDLEALERKRHE
ncbi:MAG: hypothetical protein J5I50_05165 [Chitinophagaceae bacterium]|nr:hypothetical protein [Chitinophagaceae bacterium]